MFANIREPKYSLSEQFNWFQLMRFRMKRIAQARLILNLAQPIRIAGIGEITFSWSRE
jgi:hypothetical protein